MTAVETRVIRSPSGRYNEPSEDQEGREGTSPHVETGDEP